MECVNTITIIGLLCGDPEIRTVNGATNVATMSVATTRRWTDKQGQRQERTDWHRVSVWGKQAMACKQYLRKGSAVYIQGELRYTDYTDKQGQQRQGCEITASTVIFLDRPQSADPQSQQPQQQYQPPSGQWSQSLRQQPQQPQQQYQQQPPQPLQDAWSQAAASWQPTSFDPSGEPQF